MKNLLPFQTGSFLKFLLNILLKQIYEVLDFSPLTLEY